MQMYIPVNERPPWGKWPKNERPPPSRYFLFDMDNTAICSASGRLFAQTESDIFVLPGVSDRFDTFLAEGWRVWLVTNQPDACVGTRGKLQKVANYLGVPLIAAHGRNSPHRKPSASTWEAIFLHDKLTLGSPGAEEVRFCGDAAGKHHVWPPYRWASSDRKYAEGIGATFYTPREVFGPFRPGADFDDFPQWEALLDKLAGLAASSLHLFLLVGAPGTGKSTFARALEKRGVATGGGIRHLESDDLRARRKEMQMEIKRVLGSGNSAIADATNPNFSKRNLYKHLAASQAGAKTIIVWFVGEGRKFNCERERPVPEVAYRAYSAQFESPEKDGVPVEIVPD